MVALVRRYLVIAVQPANPSRCQMVAEQGFEPRPKGSNDRVPTKATRLAWPESAEQPLSGRQDHQSYGLHSLRTVMRRGCIRCLDPPAGPLPHGAPYKSLATEDDNPSCPEPSRCRRIAGAVKTSVS